MHSRSRWWCHFCGRNEADLSPLHLHRSRSTGVASGGRAAGIAKINCCSSWFRPSHHGNMAWQVPWLFSNAILQNYGCLNNLRFLNSEIQELQQWMWIKRGWPYIHGPNKRARLYIQIQSPRKSIIRGCENFLPGHAWQLLSKTCIPFPGPLYIPYIHT